jgi:O-antigen ligase
MVAALPGTCATVCNRAYSGLVSAPECAEQIMELIAFIIFVTRASSDTVFEALPIEVGGLNVTAGAILNLLVLALAGFMMLLRNGSTFPFKVWLPFLFVATISIAWSPDKSLAVRMLFGLFTCVSLFAIPFFMREKDRSNVWLLKAMIYSSIVPAIVGILEYLFFLDYSGRVKSTFSHPNVFAFYLTVIIGLIFFLLSSSTVQFKPFIRKMMIPYSGLLIGLVVLTQTRSAWAGVLLILAVFAFFMDRRYLLLILLLPALLLVPAVSDRLDDLGRGTEFKGEIKSEADAINSFAWRTLMWQSAIEDAVDTPLFGKGLASFGSNALRFFPLADIKGGYSDKGIGAHSVYVQAGYETGLVGLGCYLAVYFLVISRALRYYRRDPAGSVMLISIILCYMSECFSDNIFEYGSLNLYFWGLLGIVFAKWELESAEAGTAPSISVYRGGRRPIGASLQNHG